MSLLLNWVPCSLSREHNYPFLTLPKTSNTLLCSTSSLPPISIRSRNPRLFLFRSLNAVAQNSSPSSVEETESEKVPRTRLIAQNIPWTFSAEDIRNLFEKHGSVTDVELSMYDKIRNRGLAFIRMGSEEEALKALKELDSYEVEDRVIRVEFAISQKKKKKNKKKTSPVQNTVTHDVYVGNLSWKVKSKDLKQFFESNNANVIAAEVVYQSETRRPAGYGFVSFRTKEEANAAISSFQGKTLMENVIQLKLSRRNLNGESKDGTQSGETSTEISVHGEN